MKVFSFWVFRSFQNFESKHHQQRQQHQRNFIYRYCIIPRRNFGRFILFLFLCFLLLLLFCGTWSHGIYEHFNVLCLYTYI